MSQDTLNKFVTVLQAVSFGLILWRDSAELLTEIVLVDILNDMDAREALREELEALDPNTPRGLAWQIIQAWANEPDD